MDIYLQHPYCKSHPSKLEPNPLCHHHPHLSSKTMLSPPLTISARHKGHNVDVLVFPEDDPLTSRSCLVSDTRSSGGYKGSSQNMILHYEKLRAESRRALKLHRRGPFRVRCQNRYTSALTATIIKLYKLRASIPNSRSLADTV